MARFLKVQGCRIVWRCDASEQETSARGNRKVPLLQDVCWLRPTAWGGRNATQENQRGMVEEVDPTLMFVPKTRRFAALAMFLVAVAGLAGSTSAQRSPNTTLEQRNLRQQIGANAVPLKRYPGLGDARFIPSDITRRVFASGKTKIQRDNKTKKVTRIQVGGTNGVNVNEQVVDLTPTPTADQLHPFWTADEQYLMYSGKPTDGSASGYQLFRVAAGAVNNGTLPGNGISSAMTNESGQDHFFPVVDGGGVRVAYAKGAAGSGNTQLYVALVPAVNQTIDPGPGGPSNVLAITEGRAFEGKAFLKVGRPAWTGTLELIFPAVLQGDPSYHLFKVNLLSFQFTRLTDGPASEENPSVSPDGRTLAFDSNATATISGTSYSGSPAIATGTGSTRNIFLMPVNGGAVQQFTNRYTGAPAVNNVQPAWSGTRQNPYTNAAGTNLWLSFASDRILTGGVFGVGSTGQKDIYMVQISGDRGNSLLSESSASLAVKLDSSDPGNIYDDEYPTWSPFINLVKMGFQSDRTGGLRTNNFGEGFTGTPSQNDVYVASLLDLNAPSLIRYNTNAVTGEIVHINLGSTYNASQSVRTREDGLVPGATAFFTVRIEDREAGLRADDDPAGGAAYIQFKNPNSLFQSQTQGSGNPSEHKEYTTFLDGGGPYAFNEAVPGGGWQSLIFANIPEGVPAVSGAPLLNQVGTEYEAQVVDRSGNYHSHFLSENGGEIYDAGFFDTNAFTGSNFPPIDAAHGQPDCWVKLSRLPNQPADGQGGVLYGASVVLPTDPSDWYVDVILYDKAVNPFDTTQQSNWIIYDNIWGFSTAVGFNPREQDVLFVSDNTLGQKFYNSRFGGDASARTASGVPNFANNSFGAESYYTDPDPSRYPGERGPFPSSGSFSGAVAPAPPGTTTAPQVPRRWAAWGPFVVTPQLGTSPNGFTRLDFNSGLVSNPSVPNPLGVASYADETIDLEPSLPGQLNNVQYALPVTGRYSIWRTLSRGPVPDIVLDSYLPRKTIAPADVPSGETSPRDVTVVNRLVVWASPFSGLSFVGSGSITDLTTQQRLARYVTNGGRLFVSGNDIGFALSGNGAQNNSFYTGTLNAQFVRDYTNGTFGAQPLGIGTARVSQITRDPFVRADGSFSAQRAYGGFTGNTAPYNPPSSGNIRVSKRFPLAGEEGNVQADGAATSDPGFSYIDNSGLGSLTGGRTGSEFTYGPSQLIRTDFTGGGTTVFFPVGFESLGNEWYTWTPPGTGQPLLIANRGRRAEIMGNVTGSLRTSTISGKLIDEQGSAVAGALVRAIRGVDDPSQKAAGTAITDGGGNFTIVGLDPDLYFVYGYSPGFYTQQVQFIVTQGGAIGRINLKLKRAAPGKLISIPVTPGVRNGGVTDTAGNGLVGVEVQLRRLNPDGKLVAFNAITQPSTPITPAGAYTFPDLLIGEYDVYVNWPKTLDESGNEIDNPLYNNIYGSLHITSNPQDGVTLGAGAVIVPATTGTGVRLRIQEGVASQIDFKLQGGSQRITGRVLDSANNQPIAGADVAATDTATGTVVATGVTGSDGRYNLQTVATPQSLDIPAGNYNIAATARGYNTVTVQQTIGGTGTVTIPDILLTKVPGGGVRGLINKATGGPLAGVTVKLFFVKPDGTTETTPTAQVVSTVPAQVDSTNFTYNFDFPVPTVPIGDYVVTYEKDGLVSNPVQVRITVTSNNITRIGTSVRMEPPRIYGAGIQLLSVPFDYSGIPGFTPEQPYTIFSLAAGQDNNGDGVVDGTDTAIFSQFNVADWTGVEYKKGNNIPIVVGKGYFVRFGEVATVARIGNTVSSSSFTLNLAPGWNLIGHPFANPTNPSQPAPDLDINTDVQVQDGTGAPVSMAQAVRDGLVKSTAFGYTGSENGGQYIQTTTIKPWLGYWFRNVTTRPLKLVFTYPTGRAVTRNLPAKTLTRADAEAITPRQITSRDVTDWRLQLAARQGNLLDTDNSVGVARDARDGYDNNYDNQKPPMLSQVPAVSLSIDGTDENSRAAAFADQIRAPGGKKSWDVSVQAPRDGEVTLYWPNINRLPRGIQPVLVDVATGKRTSLRSAATYRFNATQGATRKFRVEVGPARTAPLAIIGTRVVNVGGTRGANSGYRFAFTATQEADVQVEIQTLTGRTLRKLETRATAGGESGVFWDGRTAQGSALPAGPYVVTISARDSEGVVVRANLPLTKVR
ncbi:MAG: carboxypeptidase regulatory-like domain-containing protein [Armatimonas sp.]